MLEHLKPENVMCFFERICAIPHGSGNVEAISDFCVSFARERGLWVRQDELFNVVIVKEASAGYESAPTLILQGHMDMVCEKNADVDFDFERDGLRLKVDGDDVYAEGTTLGGDDGIALAMCMAILDDDTIRHPRLEVIFTTEEETGMDGARFLDTSDLRGKYMINLDSEEEGAILTSCAGGMGADLIFETPHMAAEGIGARVEIRGLLGGHSGVEIDKMRANANVLMGRVLFDLLKKMNVSVISLNGGLKGNAIPREAKLELCIAPEDAGQFQAVIEEISDKIRDEYRVSDPGIVIEAHCDSEAATRQVIHMSALQRILFVLFNAPNGVCDMSADLPGLVETSLNLGVVETRADEVMLRYAIRSSVASRKELLADKLQYMTEMMGGTFVRGGDYPGWAYRRESQLRVMAGDIFEQQYGHRPRMNAIHAGLECGLISEKIPGIDIISIGPNVTGIHTPDERLSISSTERTYRYVVRMLEAFPKYCGNENI